MKHKGAMNIRLLKGAALLCSAAILAGPGALQARPVLLISIDGLRPGDVLEADKRGLKVPNLRRMVAEGVSATGVVGVLPTLTYPSHTTLITGVAPARHGIVGNTTFDPRQINQGGWYWYAQDQKARTLWDAAHDAGLSTANVHWPVSVAAKSLTWNLPQIWRTGHADDAKLLKGLATDGLVDELEHACAGPYAAGIDESVEGDENRARFAASLIARHKPGFITVYLAGLDHQEHTTGPGSPQANATLERLDALVGTLTAAERAAHPDAAVAVVSDHGFAATDTEVNFFRAFIDAGLITLDGDGKVAGWDAMPWPSGGSSAFVLARPDDAVLRDRVRAVLDKLAADPAVRIARVLDAAAIAAQGGNPQAAFYVDLQSGAVASPFAGTSAPLVRPARVKGMHGHFPDLPEMRSTFLLTGEGLPAGQSLGQIDMRAIAPTLARLMNADLPDSQQPALDIVNRKSKR